MGRTALAVMLVAAAGCLTADRSNSLSRFTGPPEANRIRVEPAESTGAVRSRYVVVADVTGAEGDPLPNARVEWMLDGIGHILEVGDGRSGSRGQKIDARYAIGHTAAKEVRLRRHPDRDDDEIVVKPGQAYCVIESAIEGTSALTAYATAVRDWDRQRVTVYRHWVDADWQFPEAAAVGVGSPATLSTRITRAADRQPLSGYRVRYRRIDGPEVSPAESTVVSDADGRADLTLTPVATTPGRTRFAVEVVRPDAAGSGVIVARGETAIEWRSARLELEVNAPPAVVIGQDVTVVALLRNTGGASSAPATVRLELPDGTAFARAEPAALAAGSQVVWQVPAVAPGESVRLTAFVRTTIAGSMAIAAEATSEGTRVTARAVTEAGSSQLVVKQTGPSTAQLHDPVRYEISVSNPGNAPVSGILLRAELDPGLEHESRSPVLEVPIDSIPPGEVRSLPLDLTARSPGRHGVRLVATADGGQRARADIALEVRAVKLRIELTGPRQAALAQPATWMVSVTNDGDLPAVHVTPRIAIPTELMIRSASDDGRIAATEVTWPAIGLSPGERRSFTLTGVPARVAQGKLTAQVAAERIAPMTSELLVAFIGVPLVRAEVADSDDPVSVGRTVVYTVRLSDAGTVPGQRVVLEADFPPELRPSHATGPALGQVDGRKVRFTPLPSLDGRRLTEYRLEATAVQPGDGRVRFSVRAEGVAETTVEESTRVVPAGE